jgi:erythronate-4-phosphate dehydrogenase
MLNILIDENIAFANSAFNHVGNVKLLQGREIDNDALKDIDILIVRSITNVNEELLKNTPVKFVGTATIGTDHIDLDYLKGKNIFFADAKGCNAFSVTEYVIAALFNLSTKYNFTLKDKSIGIVGVGNVGSKVAAFAKALGMNVLLNDPPLEREGNNQTFVSLNELLKCDIITLHTPLNLSGIDKTLHLINKDNLAQLKENTILINTSRGAVIDNNALFQILKRNKIITAIDVWENEPELNLDLLSRTDIATPHIAGYSYEGKVNGTIMIYNSLCEFLNIEKKFDFTLPAVQDPIIEMTFSDRFESTINQLISNIYTITDDDLRMRKMLGMNKTDAVKEFDNQRKIYHIRREFNNYTLKSDNLNEGLRSILSELRFNVH